MKIKSIFMLLIVAPCFASCQNDEDDVGLENTVKVEVDSEPCEVVHNYWPDETTILEQGMSIKEENSTEWKKVSQTEIKGFTYEAGYYYVLNVKKTIIANPPSNPIGINYTLIGILTKEKR